MSNDGAMTEVLRRRFRPEDPASALRHHARGVLRGRYAGEHDPAWLDDVLIVISELVHNVARHTAGGGELIISVEPGGVLVEVGDTSVHAPRLPAVDPSRAGGRGLLVIAALARRWGVSTCHVGKSVWALLPTPAPAPVV